MDTTFLILINSQQYYFIQDKSFNLEAREFDSMSDFQSFLSFFKLLMGKAGTN